ncbi:hypothetical protein AB3331_04815 [Streptococcus sp. H49]|uniref:hypothetical protein n=1 Tax=Streptococcus huangxiaojuni TaxID=3237239 RepID=UPI0034A56212
MKHTQDLTKVFTSLNDQEAANIIGGGNDLDWYLKVRKKYRYDYRKHTYYV